MKQYIGFLIYLICGWLLVPAIFLPFSFCFPLFNKLKGIKIIIPIFLSILGAAAGFYLTVILPPEVFGQFMIIKGSKLPVIGFFIGIISSGYIIRKIKRK